MPLMVQGLARQYLTSFLSKGEELTDERIDEFCDYVTATVNYIKWGGRDELYNSD